MDLSGSRQLCHASGSQARYRECSVGAVSTSLAANLGWEPLAYNLFPDYGEQREEFAGKEEENPTIHDFSPTLKKK